MKITAFTCLLVAFLLPPLALQACNGGLGPTGSGGQKPSRKKVKEKKKMDKKESRYRKLTPEEERVIIHKGTERPGTGKYLHHKDNGYYTCRRCGAALYRSQDKFASGCGWPAFDDEIIGAVKRSRDADGRRTEITCQRCGGHLGHVFLGERLTPKNTRHCVNSISLDFVPGEKVGRAIFASGCFWGTEFHLARAKGVLMATSGYTGGKKDKPTYREVCSGRTGHAEAVEVLYDTRATSYGKLARLFFETHDPTQLNRQGPDIGTQYRSEIFFTDEQQKKKAQELVELLKKKGHKVVTRITRAATFWPAEAYHQDYYDRNGKKPYCHVYRKKF